MTALGHRGQARPRGWGACVRKCGFPYVEKGWV
jgi:hypothetical protein